MNTPTPVEVADRRSLAVERGRSIESGYTIPIYFDGPHYQFNEVGEHREEPKQYEYAKKNNPRA